MHRKAIHGFSYRLLVNQAESGEPRRFVTLVDDFSRHGWSGGRIEKILGANFGELFATVWQG